MKEPGGALAAGLHSQQIPPTANPPAETGGRWVVAWWRGRGGDRKEGSQRDMRTFWAVTDVPTLLTAVSRAPAHVEVAPAVRFRAADRCQLHLSKAALEGAALRRGPRGTQPSARPASHPPLHPDVISTASARPLPDVVSALLRGTLADPMATPPPLREPGQARGLCPARTHPGTRGRGRRSQHPPPTRPEGVHGSASPQEPRRGANSLPTTLGQPSSPAQLSGHSLDPLASCRL